jgi:uncharacterized membrane protein YeaQ/YmgE (transglycosylase-associated protein family)
MTWLITLVIGGVIGWLASVLMKTDAQMGLVGNVVVGIVGSWLGFWLAGLLGIGAGSAIAGYVIAVIGAAVLIFILKAVGVLS